MLHTIIPAGQTHQAVPVIRRGSGRQGDAGYTAPHSPFPISPSLFPKDSFRLDSFKLDPSPPQRLKPSETSSERVVQLKRWLEDCFDPGWDNVETILEQYPERNFSFRSDSFHQAMQRGLGGNPHERLHQEASTKFHTTAGVKRGKLLGTEIGWGDQQVALLVELHRTESPKMNLSIDLYPAGGQDLLPKGLQIMVLDEEGIVVIQVQARETENLKLQVSGEAGEYFSIKLVWNDISITENFLI
ncbi:MULTISPECIES: DUF1822 family protein [Moorena]|uniref:DUF1822 family protein n=1 Tax=Moorena bouillonii PNG TaxID=568701 RepID=A0A1U7N0Q5_9CYAN|nr:MULTISPECIES: DUF1822 family protein [Moorena]NEP29129.1 DUF1822 family protein [Moorena sp. SIO3I6]OLT59530.1 hypothetical protein BJP37_11300 [Moorena bouillonii PNG]